jgi:hypothetical protein
MTRVVNNKISTTLYVVAKSVKTVKEFYNEITNEEVTDLVFKNAISKGVKIDELEQIETD